MEKEEKQERLAFLSDSSKSRSQSPRPINIITDENNNNVDDNVDNDDYNTSYGLTMYFNSVKVPSLEQWVQEKKISQNLYNHLTNVKPAYTVELLSIMSQSDVKGLRNDFKNVNFSEILQLINVLKKLPQSQIYHDMMNQQRRLIK